MVLYWSEACDVVRFKFCVAPEDVRYCGKIGESHEWNMMGKVIKVEIPEDLERYEERRNGRYYEWLGYKKRAIYWKRLVSNERMETDWDNYMEEDLENDEYKIIDLGNRE